MYVFACDLSTKWDKMAVIRIQMKATLGHLTSILSICKHV